MADILYLTQNGVSDHIGRSQVAPYVIGLAQRGFRIHVLSAEKSGRDELIARYNRDFISVGVQWTRVPYRMRPAIVGQGWSQLDMRAAARRIVRSEGVHLVHCRSFPPALIGWELKRRFGVRFIYDFRDFYSESGVIRAGDRRLRKALHHGFKLAEGPLIRDADKVVCLTEKAASILGQWYLGDHPKALEHFQVVPCCADFSHFDPSRLSEADLAKARAIAGVSPKDFVLLYLGSLGPDYLLDRMMALFVQFAKERSSARFVFVANNGEELVQAVRAAHAVPRERISFVTVDRDEVPSFLAMADASVVFYRAGHAGCSPTKLAELFACGVPVIANCGVGDMDRIIDPKTNGSVLVSDLSDSSLHEAAKKILAMGRTVPIRENSWQFDLSAGVAKYAAVYRQLLAI